MTTLATNKSNQALNMLRELALTWQAIESHSQCYCRDKGLTGSETDVLFSLGEAGALTFRDIGERTKIAKTTLTGLIDRLEGKKLVRRENCTEDRRCTFVALTDEGHSLYDSLYPEHAAWVEKHFAALDSQELAECEGLLRRLRTTL